MVCNSSTCLGLSKAALAAALTLEALVAAALSRLLPSSPRVKGISGALAAGIFLGATFTHVLPDAAALLAHAGHEEAGKVHVGEEDKGGFPKANVIALAVFVGLVCIEGCLLAKYVRHVRTHGHHGAELVGVAKEVVVRKKPQDAEAGERASVDEVCAVRLVLASDAGAGHGECVAVGAGDGAQAAVVGHGACVDVDVERGEKDATSEVSSGSGDYLVDGKGKKEFGFWNASFLAAGLSIIGISLHSFVEALAFGLTQDFSAAISIFIAVGSHRWIVASALMVRLRTWPGLRSAQGALLFALFLLMVPIGVGTGIGLKDGLSDGVQGVLVAMAAGTILYLGVEGVVGVMTGCEGGQCGERFAAFVVGAGAMVLIDGVLIATGVGHGH